MGISLLNHNKKSTAVLSAVLIILIAILLFLLISPFYNVYRVNHQLDNKITNELRESCLFDDFQSGKSICFLGDSITVGKVTGGIPWYQPLTPYINGPVSNYATSGWKIKDLIDHSDEIPAAEIYVIAIGINDIVFSESVNAAKSADEFVGYSEELSKILKNIVPNATIYYIAPWTFTDTNENVYARAEDYRNALADYCDKFGCIFINPVPYITSAMEKEGTEKYMNDYLHPNSPDGIGLYSYAVLKAAHDLV